MFGLYLFLCCALIPLLCEAKQKVCLNMIVKNEAQVIRRCLDSVKPLIDYWVIVDTGSSDGTQEIIKNHMKGISGELYERPWKNFGESRTEALNLAKGKGDYILFMDADDVLEYPKDFKWPVLSKDFYHMWRGTKSFSYLKPQLVKANLPLRWVGVTHEYLDCNQPHNTETLQKILYVSKDDGASSHDPKKFQKNVDLLKAGLKEEPHNSRYAFYLAESYRDAGEKGNALEWYQKRIHMGGWEEEIFWSKLQIGLLMHEIGLPSELVITSYMNAHDFRPHRSEPIYYLSQFYNQLGEYEKAYAILKEAQSTEKFLSKDSLFNMDWVQDYGLLFQLSICSYFVGEYKECLATCDQLLANKNLPESWKKQVEANRTFPVAKLKEKKAKSK